MKKNILLLLLSLWLGTLSVAFSQNVNTFDENSPAVIAQNFSAQYDVRPDAILAVLWVYEQEGYDPQERKRRTEAVIKMYKETPEKKQRTAQLSDATKTQLGLSPALADALDWDLFARKNYLSLGTAGANSPAVVAGGDVNIWYGVPPKVVRALADFLEKNKVDIADLEKRLGEQVKKYEELKAEFEAYGPNDPIVKKAGQLLEEGKLLEVEKLWDSNLPMADKRLAYRHFFAGGTKELLLKYDTAAIHYQKAIVLDPQNSKYLQAYANIEYIRAHYDEAIKYYQKVLAIVDTVPFKDQPEKAAVYNNLGLAWYNKGEYDQAIKYFERSLAIDSVAFGNKDPSVARDYNNLGLTWIAKGKYDLAIACFEKARLISIHTFGEKHPNVAIQDSNLSEVYRQKGDFDQAIIFSKNAFSIFVQNVGNQHPIIANQCNNLGAICIDMGDYDNAIIFFKKALDINSVIFGTNHPTISTSNNGIGNVYLKKGNYDQAITFFKKVLAIDSVVYGIEHPNIAIRYNNLGQAYFGKGDFDQAITFYEKAISILNKKFESNHSLIATLYSNLGMAWQHKGDYERAIDYYNKAQLTFIQLFGEKHPNIAVQYNNFGAVWQIKGDYSQAITFYEKALAIDSVIFGSYHPTVAREYNNIGSAWYAKGKYDYAITFFEKTLSIFLKYLGTEHPDTRDVNKYIRLATNDRSKELFREKKYAEANLYFRKALKNAEQAKDWSFLLTSLNEMGSMQKEVGLYAEGLAMLEEGLYRAEQITIATDEIIKKLPPETLQKSEVQAEIAELKNTTRIRQMRHHKAGCLCGLGRKKESNELYQQLLNEAIKVNDIRLLEALKTEGRCD